MHATDFPAVGFGKVVPRVLRRHALVTALLVAAPYAGSVAGTFLLVAAYRSATGETELRTFHLFWLGILAFLVPTTYRLLGFAASRGERIALVAATGGFLFIPKVLRDPHGPVYFDELAHWRQSEDLRITGELFTPNSIVHFAQFFPGLDSVDVALHRLTGLSTFATATALLAVAHVAALLGVFRLGERILGSARLGALAALVYGLNTSFMYFDSQYSYESLGFLFFIWALVCAVEALSTPPGAARVGWVAGALASAGACTVTHHLTSYYLTFALAFITAAAVIIARRPGRAARQALATIACITVAVAACACAWVMIVTPDIVSYFAPAIHRGVEQVAGLAQRASGPRELFAQSTTPGYERVTAHLAPAFAFALALIGLWAVRRRLLKDPALLGLSAFGAMYFVSLPFILTQGGAEGARRSWAFTSLGLCLTVAVGLAASAGWARRFDMGAARLAGISVLTAIVAVIAVGNVASGVSVQYRFPGAFEYGSDARTVSRETTGALDWMGRTAGTGNRTIADRDTGMAFGALGGQWIEKAWVGLPLWEFMLQVKQPNDRMLEGMRRGAPRYLVIDSRMAEQVPRTRAYFAPDEPKGIRPVPFQALAKYASVPWAIQIYGSDNYRIYRLDLSLLDTCSDVPRRVFGGPDCRKAPS